MNDEQNHCHECGAAMERCVSDSLVTCPDCLVTLCSPDCMVRHNGLGALLE